MTQNILKIGILGSGSGTNMQSICDAISAHTLDARIVCVASDVPNAGILDRAKKHGIPCRYIDPAPFKTKLEGRAEDEYIEFLSAYGADVVVLAGFMRIVKKKMLDKYHDRVVNIHPALLPAFPGIAAWKQALEYGVKITGCTVHLVDSGTDTGPIIVQKPVPVLEGDTPDSLHKRIQEQEHKAYPEALQILAAGKWRKEGRRIVTA